MKKRGKFKKTTTLPDPQKGRNTEAIAQAYMDWLLYGNSGLRLAAMSPFISETMRFTSHEKDFGPETYIH